MGNASKQKIALAIILIQGFYRSDTESIFTIKNYGVTHLDEPIIDDIRYSGKKKKKGKHLKDWE